MKKTLRQIFEEGTETDLKNLIQQNDAPELSEDTLDSIKNKVYAKTGLSQAHAKKKKPLLLRWQSYVAAAACLCLVVGLMFGVKAWQAPVEPISEADLEKINEFDTLIQNLDVERANADDIYLDANTLAVFIDKENNLVLKSSDGILFQQPIAACRGTFTGWASFCSSSTVKLLTPKASLNVFQGLFNKVQYLTISEDSNAVEKRIMGEINQGFFFLFRDLDSLDKVITAGPDVFDIIVLDDGTLAFWRDNGVYYVSESGVIDSSELKKAY